MDAEEIACTIALGAALHHCPLLRQVVGLEPLKDDLGQPVRPHGRWVFQARDGRQVYCAPMEDAAYLVEGGRGQVWRHGSLYAEVAPLDLN